MFGNSSSPNLTGVTFSANTANWGGGVFHFSTGSLALTNVTFSGNTADQGGGIYIDESDPTLTNVTFSANSASSYGGGMYNEFGSAPQVRNTILWGNTAGSNGAQIYNVTESAPAVSDSVVEGGYAGGTRIITADPRLGALGDHGGSTQTIPLLAGSSALDTGSQAVCPAADQRGVSRPQGARCDIGAYELDDTAPQVMSILRLDPSPTGLAQVGFSVAFSEAVTGVEAAGFALTATGGITGAAVTGVSGSGGACVVTVDTGSGSGSLRLEVPAGAAITDLAGNPLDGLPYTGGEAYAVVEYTLFLPLIRR
jgi:predicted outer membrane repeat protein